MDKQHAAETTEHRSCLGSELAGVRLDLALARLFPEHSRARLQRWVREGTVRVNGSAVKPGYRIQGGEELAVAATAEESTEVRAQPMDLAVVHEDAAVIVIDKPPGLVVHPAAGNRDGTLQNGLLAHDPDLAGVPRAGIVHRLDKLTSGLLVVARTPRAHTALVRQLQARSVSREYLALVRGRVIAGGTVDAPIGRHPRDRVRMAVVAGGRPAVTHYRVERRYRDFTLLEACLETGRTHQIRVHLAHLGFPLVGDPEYGGRQRLPAGAGTTLAAALQGFRRQALHARRLAFDHPDSGARVRFEAPPPRDFRELLTVLDAADAPADRG